MLAAFYRETGSADATVTMFTLKEGIIAKVIIFNNNTSDTVVRLSSDSGMIYFEKTLPSKDTLIMELDTYISNTESIKFYSSLPGAHCTVNFLEK